MIEGNYCNGSSTGSGPSSPRILALHAELHMLKQRYVYGLQQAAANLLRNTQHACAADQKQHQLHLGTLSSNQQHDGNGSSDEGHTQRHNIACPASRTEFHSTVACRRFSICHLVFSSLCFLMLTCW